MDVDYSPTGREFVAGGYARSVRIFAHNGGHSREVCALFCWGNLMHRRGMLWRFMRAGPCTCNREFMAGR